MCVIIHIVDIGNLLNYIKVCFVFFHLMVMKQDVEYMNDVLAKSADISDILFKYLNTVSYVNGELNISKSTPPPIH